MTGRPGQTFVDRVQTNWRHLDSPHRNQGLDLARGLAVLGMLAAHLLVIPAFTWTDPASWTAVTQGRSSILFATLAGVSLGLAAGGPAAVRGAELHSLQRRLVLRAVAIWLLGVVVSTLGVPVYVILPAYGILFLIAVPAIAATRTQLIVLAVLAALLMPVVQTLLDGSPWWTTDAGFLTSWLLGWHYPFLVWSTFILAGLALARYALTTLRTQVAVLLVGAVLATLGYTLDALTSLPPGFLADLLTAEAHSSGLLEVMGSGGFALFIFAACMLLSRTPVSVVMLPVRAVGTMPLTAYVLQLLVWAVIAGLTLDNPGDLSGFRALQPFWPFAIGTIVVCTLWAALFGRGPLERVLPRLSRPAVASPDALSSVER